MSKFMLSMALVLASLTGLAGATEPTSSGQPVLTVTAAAEPSSPDHWELCQRCTNMANALAWARYYQSKGYQTDIRLEGGTITCIAWLPTNIAATTS
jgi:hypothetical protein